VVKALKVSLLQGETPRVTPTTSTEAYTLYLQALALDPGNAGAFGVATVIAPAQGHFDEALQLAKRVVALDPLSALNYGSFAGLGGAYLASGRLADADAAYRQALAAMEQETDERYRDVGRALALDALGRRAEADRARAIAAAKYAGVVEYPIAVVYANRRDLDQAYYWLSRAYQLHAGWVPWVPWDPLLQNLRNDPRYKTYLRRMNLPD
jgi:tetratricopeptide (TPR) repeat protein